MKLFAILGPLVLSVAAFGQTVCNSPATGPQPYSAVPGGTGAPVHTPGALDEFLGYIPQPYAALAGEPTNPLAFCGPAWQANFSYSVGNMIQLSNGTIMQAVSCAGACKSGATAPPGFSGPLYWPSAFGAWVSTCSESDTTATCETVSATDKTAPINAGQPYPGADVGATMIISNYGPDVSYSGAWTVTASTVSAPYTFSFTARSGLGSGDCGSMVGGPDNCVTYQQGSQVVDNTITWQDVGPQNENLLTPLVAVVPASWSITVDQALSVTVTVGAGIGEPAPPTPTGTVTLSSGSYSSGGTTLSDGSATINVPAGSLATGSDVLTATYSGDPNYTSTSGATTITVTSSGLLTPTVGVTPASSTITTQQSLGVTIAVSGPNGDPTPTGTVTLTSGSYNSGATTLSSGSTMITIPAGTLAVGSDTLTGSYSGDSNYNPATGQASVTVTSTQAPSFTISGTNVTVSAGATSGNTSTITVTPANGFTGSVSLSAAITSQPSGAQDLPTFAFTPTSVDITGNSAVTATLTISTTAPTSGGLNFSARPGMHRSHPASPAIFLFPLFGVVVFGAGVRGMSVSKTRVTSRGRLARVGWVAILVFLIGVLLSCSSSSNTNVVTGGGTTPGSYTVTVTGAQGSTTANNTITLTVQ